MSMFFKKKLISIITAAACIFTGICFYGDNTFESNTVSAAETTGKTAFMESGKYSGLMEFKSES